MPNLKLPNGILAAFAMTLIYGLFSLGLIYLANNEYENRSNRTIELHHQSGDGHPVEVLLLLHRISPDENAVEASFSVAAYGRYLKDQGSDQQCLTLRVYDRSPDMLFADREFFFPCGRLAGTNFAGGQTPRFLLPIHPGVKSFPLDRLEVWPGATLTTRDGGEPVNYRVVKLFPDRILEVANTGLNWEIEIHRSTNEKIVIFAGAVLFVILCLVSMFRIFTSPRKFSGAEDAILIGGFIIAAAGFREVLGVSATSRATSFEIIVFILPLCGLMLSLIWNQLSVQFIRPGD